MAKFFTAWISASFARCLRLAVAASQRSCLFKTFAAEARHCTGTWNRISSAKETQEGRTHSDTGVMSRVATIAATVLIPALRPAAPSR